MFEFTEGASLVILNYVQSVRTRMSSLASAQGDEKRLFETFLSDYENTIKFLANRLSFARDAKVVDTRDVRSAVSKMWIELHRSRRIFALHYKEVLGDIDAVKDGLKGLEKPLILDVGCGWGRASRGVNNLLDRRAGVIGVDLDLFALKYGRSIDGEGCYLKSHMSHLPFRDHAFDVAISNMALHEIDEANDKRQAFAEIARVLKTSGIAYVSEPFVSSYVARLFQNLLHRLRPRTESSFQPSEFENSLKEMGLKVIRKRCATWPAFNIRSFCSYVAEKTETNTGIAQAA